MEEKKQIKISLKTAIVLTCIVLAIAVVSIYLVINKLKTSTSNSYTSSETISIKTYKDKDYYIIEDDYSADYDLQFLSLARQGYSSEIDMSDEFEVKKVMDYASYKSYCDKWGAEVKYTDSSKNYIVFSYLAYGFPNLDARLADVKYSNGNVDLYIWDHQSGYTADVSAYILTIPTDKKISNINIIAVYTHDEFNNIKKHGRTYEIPDITVGVDKPLIYLYPTEDIEVSVKLLKSENLTCSYPKYENEWKVYAQPDGKLRDLYTNRQLYSLYYESKTEAGFKVEDEGFVIKGENTIEFLEEKLAILGLTEREAEEFIVYWLPKLEANKYNYIRFATYDEINENMPLEINPNPDTIIRVLMIFKGLEQPISVQEQKLTTPNRTGFVVVEWGGTEL